MGKQKKVWSQAQDQLLRRFYQAQQMRNWSLIAKKMFQQHNTPKKSGKQCRQRYQNHIDTSVIKVQWTKEQQKQLIRLHDQIGNKWANIALQLPGKSDNCVKNHFYSKLRKVLRKLNKTIHHYFRREFREININVIYKLVQATEQKFKQSPNCSEQSSLKCRDIQNRMLDVVIGNQEQEQNQGQQNLQLYRDMVRRIYAASKQYKRKSKKSRNLSIQTPNVKKGKQHKSKTTVVKPCSSKAPSDGYMSDSQQGSVQEQSKQSYENNYLHNKNKLPHNTFIVNQQQQNKKGNQVIVGPQKKIQIEQGKEGIENMLRQNNILQNGFTNNNMVGNAFKFSDKSSFKSYNSDRQSDKDFFNIFQASDHQVGSRRKNSKYLYFSQKMDDNKSVCNSQKQ